MNLLDISAYELESVTLELRHKDAYELWDRSGSLWRAVSSRLPTIKLNQAQPNVTKFTLEDDFELSAELTRMVLTQFVPNRDLKRFGETATIYIDTVARELAVTDFTRIGFRLTYWKSFASNIDAAAAIQMAGLIKVPEQNPVGKDAVVSLGEYAIRWENKTRGVSVAIRAQNRNVQVEIPINLRRMVSRKANASETFGVLQDVDVYTIGVVGSEQFRPGIWIDQALAISKKALKNFNEG